MSVFRNGTAKFGDSNLLSLTRATVTTLSNVPNAGFVGMYKPIEEITGNTLITANKTGTTFLLSGTAPYNVRINSANVGTTFSFYLNTSTSSDSINIIANDTQRLFGGIFMTDGTLSVQNEELLELNSDYSIGELVEITKITSDKYVFTAYSNATYNYFP